MTIHPTAIVDSKARIADDVEIGPFCQVGPDVVLEQGVRLVGSVTVAGITTIGPRTVVYPNAVLGGPPQNVRHKGGPTTLTVGGDCIIREGVTMHLGSDNGIGKTVVGSNGYFMAYSHVGHDSLVGNHVTMANNTCLGGHADIGDHVIISGYAAVHQFTRVGHHAFLGGFAAVVGDVIPFGMAVGDRARLRGLNIVGLKRSGMSRADIHALRAAYRMLFSPDTPMAQNLDMVEQAFGGSQVVADIVAFVRERGKRQFTVPLRRGHDLDDDEE